MAKSDVIASLEDLIERVPAEFVKCEIAIAHDGLREGFLPISRVAFHEDGGGRRVLVMYRDEAPAIKKQ